ncbi:MAG: InlB B-repeat-containing protein [Oscillospiraceae bacterium]|nr:InlB B-repeat-containing protein [Oscillospiraceae bacterium]
MKRRLGSALLTVWLLLGALSVTAYAGATETDSFLPGYTLTGDGAADMISIALAQEGRTGAEFGYDDQWCAYFISDCARIAGQTPAIPPHGTCTYLYQRILNAGGTITTNDPKPGDICFINWKGGTRMSHVELVYRVEDGLIYTVGGNTGGGDTYQVRKVALHAPIDESCILTIVRPDYGRTAAENENIQPTQPPQPEIYTVYYNSDGGTGLPENQKKTEDIPLKLSEKIPEKEGYRFLGWTTRKGTWYNPGDFYDQNYNVNLYANWEFIPTEPPAPPETVPETIPETVPETIPETIPETVPETISETVPETIPETVPEAKPEWHEKEDKTVWSGWVFFLALIAHWLMLCLPL